MHAPLFRASRTVAYDPGEDQNGRRRSVGEGNPVLKPLRRIGRVVTTPWLGDSLLGVAERVRPHVTAAER